MSTTAVVTGQAPAWHDPLLQFLPLIRSIAVQASRGVRASDRDEAIQEIVARTTVSWAALAAQGRARFWLIKPLAHYAVRQRRAGRRVGTPLKQRDLFSEARRPMAKRHSLETRDEISGGCWRDVIADSRNTNPAEAACFRIDFEEWLRTLSSRHRQVALALADGDSPKEIACRLQVSPGRVSQLRAELRGAWAAFQAELPVQSACLAAA